MSRYHQLYNTDGTPKFQTLATGAYSTRTSAISGNRITIFTGSVPQFVEFGTSTVVATTSSSVAPANSMIDFHFDSGNYVAVLSSSGASSVTILDSD